MHPDVDLVMPSHKEPTMRSVMTYFHTHTDHNNTVVCIKNHFNHTQFTIYFSMTLEVLLFLACSSIHKVALVLSEVEMYITCQRHKVDMFKQRIEGREGVWERRERGEGKGGREGDEKKEERRERSLSIKQLSTIENVVRGPQQAAFKIAAV